MNRFQSNKNKFCTCPALPKKVCNWTGTVEELPLHFVTYHPELTITKPSCRIINNIWIDRFVEVNHDKEENLLLVFANYSFLLQLKTDLKSKTLWCGARCIGRIEGVQRSFKLMVKVKSKTKSCVVQPNDRWIFDTKSMIDIDLNSIKVEKDKKIKSNPKCSVCEKTFDPPLFSCKKGHVIVCELCKIKNNKCKLCSSRLKNATKVHYTCRNHSVGCDFKQTLAELKIHERDCFAMTSCLFGCEYEGTVRHWWNHLTVYHEDVVHKRRKIQSHNLSVLPFQCVFFLTKWGIVCKVTCQLKAIDSSFTWTCQQVGLEDLEAFYKLRVEVVHPTDGTRNWTGKVKYCSITAPDKTPTDGLVLPYSTLKSFIHEQVINIRYNIMKVNM